MKLINKLLIIIIAICTSTNIQGQQELEFLYQSKVNEIFIKNKVKTRITFIKMGNEYEDIKHEFFNTDGKLDSIKEVPFMWCTPCVLDENGKLIKNWKTKQIKVNSNFETKEKEIIRNLNSTDFTIDTSITEDWKNSTSYLNSKKIFSFSQVKDGKVILKTSYKYNNQFNILSKLEYRNHEVNYGTLKHNASNITYYEYNKFGLREKEIIEHFDIDRTNVITYKYNKKKLLIKKETHNQSYQFKYEFH